MKKYEIMKVIGDGTYGIVYEGINKETKQKVAVKRLKEKCRSMEECLSRIEVVVLEKLTHENIVQLKEVIRDKKGEVSYIFEYCDCNLYEFIEHHRENKKFIPEPVIREIVLQITKGMKYMHSKQYFHRDLKPENILLILNNYNLNNLVPGEIKVKIADFGTAKEIPIKNILPMTDYVCTRWYRPPECILRADNYDEKMDVWAIGCIMAELYHLSAIFPGENEFDQLNQVLKILGTPTRAKWPWGYSQSELFGIQLPVYYKKDFKKILGYICKDGINLLNEIFTFDPEKRPSCSKLLNHSYFKAIPKPRVNTIPNSLRSSNRKSSYVPNKTESNSNTYKPNKNYTLNTRTNNNSINKSSFTENLFDFNINKNNINQVNNNNTKRNTTLKILNNNININLDDYKNNNIDKQKGYISGKTKLIQNNNIQSINSISTTDRKAKHNNSKYVKIVETKSGNVTKKILKYTKNNEESKINDNKNENKNDKKEIIIRRIGRNEEKFADSKKSSFIYTRKTEEKEDYSRNKSIDTLINHRNTISSNKYIYPKSLRPKNNPINENKKNINHKIVDITYDNKNNDTYKNHKDHYIKYKPDKKNISKSIAKSFYFRRNERNSEKNSEKSSERNSERNNNKIYLKTKNLNSYNNKKKTKKNHNFYESKEYKYNNLNNHKFININNYNTYNENENNNKLNNNQNNICICAVGRNNSAKRNLLHDKDYRHTIKKPYNIQKLEDFYKNNTTPKNHRHSAKKNYKKTSQSPNKRIEKYNSLFSSFIKIKNDENNIFEKSQSLIKNNNNSTINLNEQSNSLTKDNKKKKVNIMSEEVLEDINYPYNNNNISSFVPNSTSKKTNIRNNKN